MTETNAEIQKHANRFELLSLKYVSILFISFVIAIFSTPALWTKNVHLVHTIIELVCIFIALATFIIIWSTDKNNFSRNHILGFGFLIIAVFDCFHAYYWFAARELAHGYPDLPTRYWIIGRLAEALVFLVFTLKHKEFHINKWSGLCFALALSFGVSLLVLFFPGIMPIMLTEAGLTPAKIILEYLVIAMTLLTLYRIKDHVGEEDTISYKNILMALLLIIPAELSFTMYREITSIFNMYGHILKILCYYYIYKAVYVSCIEYPYKRLAEAYGELEITYKRINEMDQVLNDTLDASPIGILFYKHDGRIKYINRRLEELFACDRNALCGLTAEEFLKVIPAIEHGDSIFMLTHESINDSVNVIKTFRNMRGECIKLSLTSQKIKDGILVYFHEAKREQEIKNFHLQTQTILNAVSNAIIMIDKKGKIVHINEACKKVIEIDDTDIIGMDIDKFNDMVGFKDKYVPHQLLSGEMIEHHMEVPITTPKGNRRELLIHVAPIKNVDDEIIGALSASSDITEIKKHDRIMQQQEKLAMIGQMAAGIVHEIKNPLATIKGLSQLIKSKSGLDKVKEYAGVINTAIDDTSRVVDEFLNFAKPKPTIKTRTSINRIVESMQLITETQCYTKNIKSQFHYSAFPMEITADENKIKQVILNLTENAIAAMEDTEAPELIITTYYNADKNEGVIQVKDNGIGMSAEILEKLGTPFYTTREKGTGLGLGICYQIINEHHGRIGVQSEEGKGTTFEVIFTQIEDLI